MLKLNTEYIESETFKNMSPYSRLDYKEISKLFSISPGHLKEYIEAGRIPPPEPLQSMNSCIKNMGNSLHIYGRFRKETKRKWLKHKVLLFVKEKYGYDS